MMCKIAILLIAFNICSATAFPACLCTRDYRPVCGSDGETYANNCMFECAVQHSPNLKISSKGMCNGQPCDCTYEYLPVCGSDGVSYPNQCVLGCEIAKNPNLKKSHDGHCQ